VVTRFACLEDGEMLADRLAGHVRLGAEFAQGLAVARVQPIEQEPPARVASALKTSSIPGYAAIRPPKRQA
jgi:hypothetical protein